MPFTIVCQDLTAMEVDAIVNAANTELKMGGGVCGAIFRAAGEAELRAACDALAPIRVGQAVLTPGFRLPARYVIHAAGPAYNRWRRGESRKRLRSAYLESLRLAEARGCESVAFPLISSGLLGYPKAAALEVARQAIRDFLADHDMDVYLVIHSRADFLPGGPLPGHVGRYLDRNYTAPPPPPERRKLLPVEEETLRTASMCPSSLGAPMAAAAPSLAAPQADWGLENLIKNLDEPFSDALLRLIDLKGRSDVEVYKRANLDRKLFSKIRTNKSYTPRKPTILALAVALELTLEETDALLERAGYALSHASRFDVIVEYFIFHRQYDIFQINEVLFAYDQPLLGS